MEKRGPKGPKADSVLPVHSVSFSGFVEKVDWDCRGGLAQLGERLPCKQEVAGSIPTISTKKEYRKALNQIKAQRSGFDLKRRRSGASELSPEGGSEGCGICADERARSSAG